MHIRRHFRFLRRIVGSNVRRLSFPYKLTFAVTYRCNSRCRTCSIWQKPAGDELRTDEIRKFFEKSRDFSWIDLTGGEIFLRDDCVEIARAAIEQCRDLCLLHFPTNGLLTDRIVSGVRRILELGPPRLIITVSVDGDEELNDTIRGVPGGWRRQIATFKALRALRGVQTVLGMTLSPFNYDKYEATFAAVRAECPDLRHEDFHVNVAHVSGHYYDNEDLALDEMPVDVVIEEIAKYAKRRGLPLHPVTFLERQYLKRVPTYLNSGRTPVRCHALRSSCFVDPEGNVFPCGMYDRKLGNLREVGYELRRIWESEPCRAIQREIWSFNCPQCWTPCEAYQSLLGRLFRRRHAKEAR